MQFNEYQNEATKYSVVRGEHLPKLMYLSLGVAGEAGELANRVKKLYRDNEGKVNPETREKLKLELGDMLWYISEISNLLEYDFEYIAKANLEKIEKRKQEGTIKGDGDSR